MAKLDIYEDLPEEILNDLLEEEEEKKSKSFGNRIRVLKKEHDERQALRKEAETNLTAAMSKKAIDALVLEPDDPKAKEAAKDAKALSEAAKIVNDNRTFATRAAMTAGFGALGAVAIIATEKATRTGLVGTARDGVSSLVKKMIKRT